MKKSSLICVLSAVFVLMVLNSCDIQKRHYRSGYYFGGGHDIVHSSAVKKENQDLHAVNTPAEDFLQNNFSAEKSPDKKIVSTQNIDGKKKKSGWRKKNKSAGQSVLNLTTEKIIPPVKKTIDEIDFAEETAIKKKSVTAMVFGILAFPCTVFVPVGIAFAIVAIVIANNAIKRARKYPRPLKSTNMAVAGKILGIVYLSLLVLAVILFFLFLFALSGGVI